MCLDFKVHSLLLHPTIGAFVEAVETGGTVSDAFLDLIEIFEEAETEDLLAEVPLVHGLLQDGFVHFLQLCKGELARK